MSYHGQAEKLLRYMHCNGGGEITVKWNPSLPCCLTEIRSLPGGLVVRPLLNLIFLGGRGIADLVVLVVLADKISDNCVGFPERDIRVGVSES